MPICEHVVHLQLPDLNPCSLWTFSSQEYIRTFDPCLHQGGTTQNVCMPVTIRRQYNS